MAAKVSFDTALRLIVVTAVPVDGLVTIDPVIDLYSDAKEDWLSTPALNKLRFPFFSEGGNPIGATKTLPPQIFLRNDLGWRLRPYEAHHELVIDGNFRPFDVTLPIFVPTIGTFTVLVPVDRTADGAVIETGVSGLLPGESASLGKVDEFHQAYGLDVANPVTHRKEPATIEFDGITLTLTTDVDGNVIVQRT